MYIGELLSELEQTLRKRFFGTSTVPGPVVSVRYCDGACACTSSEAGVGFACGGGVVRATLSVILEGQYRILKDVSQCGFRTYTPLGHSLYRPPPPLASGTFHLYHTDTVGRTPTISVTRGISLHVKHCTQPLTLVAQRFE